MYMFPGQWYLSGKEGRESIDDDERPGRPTEIVDAMKDDIRHTVQEGSHAPFLSFSSLRTHLALKRSNFSFAVKIVCIVVIDKSNNSKISHTVILPSSCTVRGSTVVMRRHF